MMEGVSLPERAVSGAPGGPRALLTVRFGRFVSSGTQQNKRAEGDAPCFCDFHRCTSGYSCYLWVGGWGGGCEPEYRESPHWLPPISVWICFIVASFLSIASTAGKKNKKKKTRINFLKEHILHFTVFVHKDRGRSRERALQQRHLPNGSVSICCGTEEIRVFQKLI